MSAPAYKLKANANSRVLSGHPWVFANEVEAPLAARVRRRGGRMPRPDGPPPGDRDLQRPLPDRVAPAQPGPGGPGRGLPEARPRAGDLEAGGRGLPPARMVGIRRPARGRRGPVRRHGGPPDPDPGDGEEVGADRRTSWTDCSIPPRSSSGTTRQIRRLEGLPLETHTRSGRPWEPRWGSIDGFEVWLDLMGGQKTGFYLDQRAQHAAVAKYCAGKRVLDAFCNQGSFAIHAGEGGGLGGAGPGQRGGGRRGGPAQRGAQRRSARRSRWPTCSTGSTTPRTAPGPAGTW